ncbi:MAG: 2-oxoacid:acceptor oxidoreductase family protein [Brevinematales bacterium]|nr:2-oxoacid:acceptor oxidoreductase family protein [Brevinematales bacterium]
MSVLVKEFYDIRIHGRAGQGAKTAAQLVAESAIDIGMYAQSFPEFGAERTGAPVKAYARISKNKIEIHYQITNPDVIVVMDETLFNAENVVDGIKEDGVIIVNTNENPEKVREKYRIPSNIKLYTLNATGIAIELFGRDFSNIPLLGAVVKLTGVIDPEKVKAVIRSKFIKKLGEEGVSKNITAFERGMNEIIGG